MEKFDDIDVFCRLYSGQEKIAKAAMALHVSILKAVEDVIGFYTKHIGKSSHIMLVRDCRVNPTLAELT